MDSKDYACQEEEKNELEVLHFFFEEQEEEEK